MRQKKVLSEPIGRMRKAKDLPSELSKRKAAAREDHAERSEWERAWWSGEVTHKPYANPDATWTTWGFIDYFGEQYKLKTTERAVLLCLARHVAKRDVRKNASATGDFCFPAVVTISRETGACTTTVKQCIARLKEMGIVTVSRDRRARNGRSFNVYQLRFLSPEIRAEYGEWGGCE